jgi:DNA (cytosine-5)-methyltransferase 1
MYELAGVDLICGGFPCQDISTAGKGAEIDGERSGLWHEFARIIGEVRPRCVIVENVSALLGRGLGRVLGNLAALGYDAEWHCIPASYVGAPHRRDRVWIIAYAQREQLRQQSGRCGGPSRAGAAQPAIDGEERNVAHADEQSMGRIAIARRECNQWLAEPNVGRVANGVPSRAYRLRVLGNAVVPQVVEIIGRAIIEAEERCASPLG